MDNDIVLFESGDGQVTLPVRVDATEQEIWLNRAQLAVLFDRDVKTIGKHINNALREELAGQREVVVAQFATTRQHGAMEGRTQTRLTEHYGLDMVLSVGYRVKSKRGVEFRRWATGVLHRYIMEGSAVNERRLRQLSQVTSVMARIPERLETRQVLDIVQSYTVALDLLDDYDHQRINLPEGTRATYALSYDECIAVIKSMRFAAESDLFGVEKDDSFRSSIASIHQTFDGQEIYPTLQEKASNLLYFIIKNHSFLDGNKRIAATMFLYFLDRNNALFFGDCKAIDDSTLVAITVMIAESLPEEKDSMVALVMNFLAMSPGK